MGWGWVLSSLVTESSIFTLITRLHDKKLIISGEAPNPQGKPTHCTSHPFILISIARLSNRLNLSDPVVPAQARYQLIVIFGSISFLRRLSISFLRSCFARWRQRRAKVSGFSPNTTLVKDTYKS